MKVLILGATGSIGRELVPKALAAGHLVTALLRRASLQKVTAREGLDLVEGNVLEPVSMLKALHGKEAVIFAIGRGAERKPTTLFSESTRILIRGMESDGVRRLVCITGVGAGDSKGHGGFFYDHIVYPLITRETYIDKDRQEALIRNSSLDWVIVRPAAFSGAAASGHPAAATDLRGVTMKSISRGDVAAFVVDQLTSNLYLHKMPMIGRPS